MGINIKSKPYIEEKKIKMGNVALSAEDVSFLKEKGANKTTTSEIKKAFKEFAEGLDSEGKKMNEVKLNFEQFCEKCDMIFNDSSANLSKQDSKLTMYSALFKAFDHDKVRICLPFIPNCQALSIS